MTYASFFNARNLCSQLGYIVAMLDRHDTANIINYGSSRCKLVTQSILAAEIHAFMLGYEQDFLIKNLAEEVLVKQLPIMEYVDSRSVFDIISKDGNKTEKWLQIKLFAIRKSYENGEIERLGWIPWLTNQADALKKLAI